MIEIKSKPTREEVEQLKTDWLRDPCYDLQDAEGFEAYRDELQAFADQQKDKWAKARQEGNAHKWETVLSENYTHTTRMKVFGGWIVKTSEAINERYEQAMNQVFVPDPKHEWEVFPVRMGACFDCNQNVNLEDHVCTKSAQEIAGGQG